jgi:hypothetical protein
MLRDMLTPITTGGIGSMGLLAEILPHVAAEEAVDG